MSTIVLFNPARTPQKVSTVVLRANTEDFGSQIAGVFVANAGVVVDPDLSLLEGFVPRKYWKHVAGEIVEYTAAEKTAQDDAETAAQTTEVRAEAVGSLARFEPSGLLLRAFADVVRDEINILRAEHALPPRTLTQLRNAINLRVNNGSVDS